MDKDFSKLSEAQALRRIYAGKRGAVKLSEPLITRVGRALHGEHFLVPLARHLAVDRRTVQRWCAEQDPVPEPIWRELRADLAERLVDTNGASNRGQKAIPKPVNAGAARSSLRTADCNALSNENNSEYQHINGDTAAGCGSTAVTQSGDQTMNPFDLSH